MTEEMRSQVVEVDISSEMRTSFLDYAMSIIVSRALPDVRDPMGETRINISAFIGDVKVFIPSDLDVEWSVGT